MNMLPTKKRFQWTFEGRNADGNIVFPECFVKVTSSPFEKMTISANFYEQEQIDKLIAGTKHVVSASLKMFILDTPAEEWTLHGVQMNYNKSDLDYDDRYEWTITYEERPEWRVINAQPNQ